MSEHWLIVERDEAYIAKFGEDPDYPERTYRIECSDPAACPGWIECVKDHSDVSDDDTDWDDETCFLIAIEHANE